MSTDNRLLQNYARHGSERGKKSNNYCPIPTSASKYCRRSVGKVPEKWKNSRQLVQFVPSYAQLGCSVVHPRLVPNR